MNALRSMVVWLIVLASPVALRADAPIGVRDEAGLFRPEAVRQVDKELQQISRIYARDVRIETVKELPPEQKTQLDRSRSSREAARLFAAWATELARDQGVNGVFVLISDIPGYKHVQVTVWPEEPPLPLRPRDRDQVRRCFTQVQKNQGPNQALKEMVMELRDCLSKNLSAGGESAALTWWTLGLLFIGILLLWGLVELGRARGTASTSSACSREAFVEDPALPGMLGEMFGSLAAQPIYDRAFLAHARQQPATAVPADATHSPVLLPEIASSTEEQK